MIGATPGCGTGRADQGRSARRANPRSVGHPTRHPGGLLRGKQVLSELVRLLWKNWSRSNLARCEQIHRPACNTSLTPRPAPSLLKKVYDC